MMKTNPQFGTCQKIIALAILGTFGQANAADDLAEFTKPESSISVGAAAVSGNQGDRAIFGQYNGMRKSGGSLQLDIDYQKREDATGTWMTLEGRNLGLDSRDLSIGYQKQGDWKFTGDYSELVHREIRTINTADTGVGSANPTIVRLATAGTGSDVNLQLKRIGLGLGIEKWLTSGLQFEASFKNEDKKGSRLWGRGYDCAAYVCAAAAGQVKNAILMVAEPVNTSTKQFEAKLNFNDEKLNLSAAYYASFFTNANGSLNPIVPGTLNNGFGTDSVLAPAVGVGIIAGGGTSLQNVLQSPMGLPPNNQSHQFSLAGNYTFTPTTKATFKYAYTHSTQNQDFSTMGLGGSGPGGVNNLGGVLDTTLFQLGLTAKPTSKLSLLANLRYERREDKTPLALYNVEPRLANPAAVPPAPTYTILPQTGVASATWFNGLMPVVKLSTKLEGSYKLPESFILTAGVDLHTVDRAVPAAMTEEVLAGLSPMRDKTTETGYRLELRRAMSETLTGTLGYASSKRKGTNWTSLSQLDPATPGISAANLALINTYCGGRACYGQQLPESSVLALSQTTPFAMSMANLTREKWKGGLNWTPIEKLSLQFTGEVGTETNTSAANGIIGGKGWRGNKSTLYGVDADYAMSDDWKLRGFFSRGDQHLRVNHSTGYMADINNINSVFGFGVLGKPSGNLEIGANFSYQNDVNKYGIQASPSLTANTGTAGTYVAPTAANLAQAVRGLPDVTFRQTTLSLFGKYAMDKTSDVRVSLELQRTMFNEWAWGGASNGMPSFTFADNTTVSMKREQNVTFLGAAYIYKFQ